MVSTTEDIRSVTPEARHCYFEDERDLTFYEKYTFTNCRLECAILQVEEILECIPWHLPKVPNFQHHVVNMTLTFDQGNNSKTCDPWTAKAFEVKMTEAQSKSSSLCPHCLPDCNHITYSSSATSAKFRFEIVFSCPEQLNR